MSLHSFDVPERKGDPLHIEGFPWSKLVWKKIGKNQVNFHVMFIYIIRYLSGAWEMRLYTPISNF